MAASHLWLYGQQAVSMDAGHLNHAHAALICVGLCGSRVLRSQNVNLLNTAKAMWPSVPSVVTNVLEQLSFNSLTSSMPAGAWLGCCLAQPLIVTHMCRRVP